MTSGEPIGFGNAFARTPGRETRCGTQELSGACTAEMVAVGFVRIRPLAEAEEVLAYMNELRVAFNLADVPITVY